jgi:hypothetical protein
MAAVIGCQRHMVSLWETGTHTPRGAYLRALEQLREQARQRARRRRHGNAAKFERVAPGIYRREYATALGETSVFYYGRLKRKRDGKRLLFTLGTDLNEAKDQWAIIKVKNRRGEYLAEYKPKKANVVEVGPSTVESWSKVYLETWKRSRQTPRLPLREAYRLHAVDRH